MSETLAERVNKLKNDTAAAENKLSELMDRIKEAREEKERLVSEREDLQRKIAARKMDLERKTKALNVVADKLRTTTSKKDTITHNNNNNVDSNNNHDGVTTYDDLFETLRELKQNKTTEECKHQELSNKLKNNHAKMDTIKQRIAKNSAQVAKDQAKLSDLQNQNSGLENNTNDQPDEDELLLRLKDTEELILQHSVRKENADRRLRNLKGQIDKISGLLSARNKEISDIEKELTGFNSLI